METYFINKDKILSNLSDIDKKNPKKIIGILVSDAFKQYVKEFGTIQPNEKEKILISLKEYASNNIISNCKGDLLLDFYDQIKKDNINIIRYPKQQLTGEQRIEITMICERNGLSCYIETDENKDKSKNYYLVVCKSKNEDLDIANLSDNIKKMLSRYMNIYFNSETFLEEIKLLNLEDMFSWFIDDIKRYGYNGYKRLMRILPDEIVKDIQSNNKYQMLIKSKPKLKGSIDPSNTLYKKLYKPENNKKMFVSIDIKSAVFIAYRELGIITEESWTEFMIKYTPSKFLINSKRLRLEIFGKINKNNINSIIIPNLIINVWNKIENSILEAELLAIEGDELILELKNDESALIIIKNIMECEIPDYINITCYHLKCFTINEKIYYTKIYKYPEGKPFDLKCAEKKEYTGIYSIIKTQI